MTRTALCLCLLASLEPSLSFAQSERRPVEDVRSLLIDAIRSPTGSAFGVAAGPLAKMLSTRFSTSSPLLIDVSTIGKYTQPDCSRLNLKFSQRDVVETNGAKPSPKIVQVHMNYCLSGRPPKSLELQK
jgi:hypothetical protein